MFLFARLQLIMEGEQFYFEIFVGVIDVYFLVAAIHPVLIDHYKLNSYIFIVGSNGDVDILLALFYRDPFG